MADETFTFYKTKYFWKFVNKQFDLSNMNDIFLPSVREGDYTFLLAEQVPADIYSCIDAESGCIDEDAVGLSLLDLQDVYTNKEDAEMPYFSLQCTPINDWDGGFVITIDSGEVSSIQIQVGDSQDIYLQGIFLVKRATVKGDENFVMAYATIPSPVKIRNFINLPYNGVFAGVGYCNK